MKRNHVENPHTPPKDASHRIQTLGIPTRNRPQSLERCIRSFLNHLRHFNRTADVLVVDNSTSQNLTNENRALVSSLSAEDRTPIRFMDRVARAQKADQIARQTGIPKSIIRFALLGDNRCPDSYGACRNTLLLDAAGRRSIQTDDDIVCNIGLSSIHEPGLALSSSHRPYTYQFFASREESLNVESYEQADIFSLHESLLGNSPVDILGSSLHAGLEPEVSRAEPALFSRLNQTEARIITSYPGVSGDVGTQHHTARLFLEQKALQPYLQSDDRLQMLLTTRWVQKCVPRYTLSQGSYCMTTHIGLDTRQLVPPFMPVMRNEDGVFGSVLNTCFPHAFSAHLPFLIQHLPFEKRNQHDLGQVLQAPKTRTNDLITQIVIKADVPAHPLPTLHELGGLLVQLASLSNQALESFLMKTIRQTRENIIAYSREYLAEFSEAPIFWVDAVNTYINAQIEAIDKSHGLLPDDLPGSPQEKLLLFKDLLGQYGNLLIHWQKMFDAC